MKTLRPRVRRCAVALAAAVALVAPAACASDSSNGEAGSGEAVTIEHSLGTTEIEGTPERVVTIGNQWTDALQALGVTPVGYIDTVSVTAGGAKIPWEPESLAQATKLDQQGDIVEQIAGLNPDLVLGPGYLINQSMYDKLSNIAPTVVNIGKAQIDPWDQQVDALGKVLRKSDDAKKVIDDVNGRIDSIAERNPGLKGKTFLTTFLYTPTQLMVLANPQDGASAVFVRLGMVAPQNLVDQASSSGGRLALSPERVADLNSDLLVATASAGMETTFENLPGYSTLPSVQKNSLLFLDLVDASALNGPTALSMPYLLDKLEPALVNAAK